MRLVVVTELIRRWHTQAQEEFTQGPPFKSPMIVVVRCRHSPVSVCVGEGRSLLKLKDDSVCLSTPTS